MSHSSSDPQDTELEDEASSSEATSEAIAVTKEEEKRSLTWFQDEVDDDISASVKDYDVSAIPNDFNIKTIADFLKSGAVKIPGFQRNFVWDIKRASRLIESILIGLPIPQVFLYQEGKNNFQVIDGQQRLMSIYYFVVGRFPKVSKRPMLRRLMSQQGQLTDDILEDDEYFIKFNLQLKPKTGSRSRFHGKNYLTLGDSKLDFDLRTVRNVVIKQNAPDEDSDSSIFEIFNRLNTGGVNLQPQEIRLSLYHSQFFQALHRVNLNNEWRRLVGFQDPDLHDKDVEILLRAFALVVDGEHYAEPMSGFLSGLAKKSKKLSPENITYMEKLFQAFFDAVKDIPREAFTVTQSGRFNIAAFDGIFRAACTPAFQASGLTILPLTSERLHAIRNDEEFTAATQEGVGRKFYVNQRAKRAKAILEG